MANNRLTFDAELCKGCLLCVTACPKKILEPDCGRVNAKGHNPIFCKDIELCTACAICAIICPDSVIAVEKELDATCKND